MLSRLAGTDRVVANPLTSSPGFTYSTAGLGVTYSLIYCRVRGYLLSAVGLGVASCLVLWEEQDTDLPTSGCGCSDVLDKSCIHILYVL